MIISFIDKGTNPILQEGNYVVLKDGTLCYMVLDTDNQLAFVDVAQHRIIPFTNNILKEVVRIIPSGDILIQELPFECYKEELVDFCEKSLCTDCGLALDCKGFNIHPMTMADLNNLDRGDILYIYNKLHKLKQRRNT